MCWVQTDAAPPRTRQEVTAPLPAYRVPRESAIQSRFEVAVKTGLTSLVGRDHEVGLLRDRWERAKAGAGQVVLVSGEPGIGKSRLVQELKEQVNADKATRIEFRCLPYHQTSAFYPIIDHLQRLLQFTREDSPALKLEKLQQGKVGQTEKGLRVLAEALATVDKTGERVHEAELYRLYGELTLQKLSVASSQLSVPNPQSPTPNPQTEAEACFHKAIEIARRQQAKSWELRAVMSLSRLWQSQGKQDEARQMLAEIDGWFTEGFDTKDLQEAKVLLEELV